MLAMFASLLAASAIVDEATLKEKGLNPVAGYFTLSEEAELNRGVSSLRVLQRKLREAQRNYDLAEKKQQQARDAIKSLYRERTVLRSQMAAAENNFNLYNRIVNRLNQTTDQINQLQQFASDEDAIDPLREKLSEARHDFLEKVTELRKTAGEIEARYKELASDEAVKTAIAADNKANERDYDLGPSRNFARNLSQLERYEKSIVSDEITLRRRSGTFEIDVVLNDKFHKTMIFDTGASSVSLPYDLAVEIGLKDFDSAQPVNVSIADGSTVEGKIMEIESIQVGKFTVEKVQCIVMPSSLTNVPALLGGAFLNNFNYKMDPNSGKLSLSKIGEEDSKDKSGKKR